MESKKEGLETQGADGAGLEMAASKKRGNGSRGHPGAAIVREEGVENRPLENHTSGRQQQRKVRTDQKAGSNLRAMAETWA